MSNHSSIEIALTGGFHMFAATAISSKPTASPLDSLPTSATPASAAMLALSSLDTGNGNMKPPVWPSVAWVHASLKTLFLLWICVKGKSVEMVGGYWGWALESTTLLSSPRTSLRNLALASNSKVKRSWRFFLHRPPMRVFDRNEKTCKCPCTLCVTNKVIQSYYRYWLWKREPAENKQHNSKGSWTKSQTKWRVKMSKLWHLHAFWRNEGLVALGHGKIEDPCRGKHMQTLRSAAILGAGTADVQFRPWRGALAPGRNSTLLRQEGSHTLISSWEVFMSIN